MLVTKLKELKSDYKSVRLEYIVSITKQNYWTLLSVALLCIVIQSYNLIYFFIYSSGLDTRNNRIYFTFYITLLAASFFILFFLPKIKNRPRLNYSIQFSSAIYYLVWNCLFNTYQIMSGHQNNFIIFITAVITTLVMIKLRLVHSLILLFSSIGFILVMGQMNDAINYAQIFNSLLSMFASLLLVFTLFIQKITVLKTLNTLSYTNQLLKQEKTQLKLSIEKQVLIMNEYNLYYFEWNHLRDDILVSTHGSRQFQCPNHIPHPREWFEAHDTIHPDDKQLLTESCIHYLSDHAPLEIELRIQNGDKAYAWYRLRLTTQYDISHTPISTIGSLQNIEELKQVNAQIEQRMLVHLESTKQYFSHLKATQNKVLQYHHDMRHTLKLMEQLIAQRDLDTLRSHSFTANEELQLIKPKYYCDNTIINLIVGSFEQMARDENVTFTSQLDLPEDLPFTSLALCTIFFNLLENALFAANDAKKQEQRFVSIDGCTNNNKLVLNVYNGYSGFVQFSNDITTTQSNKVNHGYGIPSILSTVDSYDGMCLFKTEDSVFIAQILLPLS